jgi:hypothetical protein
MNDAEMYDDAYVEVMGRDIGDTGLKNFDLYLIGQQVLNTIGTTVMLRHKTLAGVLDYASAPGPEDHVSEWIVRDLLAWGSGHPEKVPGSEMRLRRFVAESWLEHQLAESADLLGDTEAAS